MSEELSVHLRDLLKVVLGDRFAEPWTAWAALPLLLVLLRLIAPTLRRHAMASGLFRGRPSAALALLVFAACGLAWTPGPAPGAPPLAMLPLAVALLLALVLALVTLGLSRAQSLVFGALYGLSPVFAGLLGAGARPAGALLMALLLVSALAAERDRTVHHTSHQVSDAGLAAGAAAWALLHGRLALAAGVLLFVGLSSRRWRRVARDRASRLGAAALALCALTALDRFLFEVAAWAGAGVFSLPPPAVPGTSFEGASASAPWLVHPVLAVLLAVGLGRLAAARAWKLAAAALIGLLPGLLVWYYSGYYSAGGPPSAGIAGPFTLATGVTLLVAAPAVRLVQEGVPSPRAQLMLAAGAIALVLHAQLLPRLWFDRWIFAF